jgi:hypothetical protein
VPTATRTLLSSLDPFLYRERDTPMPRTYWLPRQRDRNHRSTISSAQQADQPQQHGITLRRDEMGLPVAKMGADRLLVGGERATGPEESLSVAEPAAAAKA